MGKRGFLCRSIPILEGRICPFFQAPWYLLKFVFSCCLLRSHNADYQFSWQIGSILKKISFIFLSHRSKPDYNPLWRFYLNCNTDSCPDLIVVFIPSHPETILYTPDLGNLKKSSIARS